MTKAFISTADSEQRQWDDVRGHEQPRLALDEAARILADVEPATRWTHHIPVGQLDPLAHDGQLYAEDAKALAESLARWTADGGPLDELAELAEPTPCRALGCDCDELHIGPDCPCCGGTHDAAGSWDAACTQLAAAILAMRPSATDPVLARAQHDLDVLRAYSEVRQ